MPNLNSICGLINAALQADQFASRRYQSGQWFEIADPVQTSGESEGDKVEPMILDDFGEGTAVVFDDTSSLVVFHRLDNLQYELGEPNDYGAPGTTMREVASMRMMFTASRSKLKSRGEDMVAAAILDFPKEFLPSVISPLGMNSCIIEMGDVETDIYGLWRKEWPGTNMTLATDTVMFQIKYKIVDTFNKKCFQLCG
jgi:hypothetical protein